MLIFVCLQRLKSSLGLSSLGHSSLQHLFITGTFECPVTGTFVPGTFVPGKFIPWELVPGTHIPEAFILGTFIPGTFVLWDFCPMDDCPWDTRSWDTRPWDTCHWDTRPWDIHPWYIRFIGTSVLLGCSPRGHSSMRHPTVEHFVLGALIPGTFVNETFINGTFVPGTFVPRTFVLLGHPSLGHLSLGHPSLSHLSLSHPFFFLGQKCLTCPLFILNLPWTRCPRHWCPPSPQVSRTLFMISMKLVILLHLFVLFHSHQRWKHMRNHVCFHLWCELTPALWCQWIVLSVFSREIKCNGITSFMEFMNSGPYQSVVEWCLVMHVNGKNNNATCCFKWCSSRLNSPTDENSQTVNVRRWG